MRAAQLRLSLLRSPTCSTQPWQPFSALSATSVSTVSLFSTIFDSISSSTGEQQQVRQHALPDLAAMAAAACPSKSDSLSIFYRAIRSAMANPSSPWAAVVNNTSAHHHLPQPTNSPVRQQQSTTTAASSVRPAAHGGPPRWQQQLQFSNRSRADAEREGNVIT